VLPAQLQQVFAYIWKRKNPKNNQNFILFLKNQILKRQKIYFSKTYFWKSIFGGFLL
jgi:hypothetical protein